MSELLEVRNLTKRFTGLVAVQDVSFEMRENEILGLIGPNGAGKSTLVGLVRGTLTPSAGEIRFEGRSIRGLPASIARAWVSLGHSKSCVRSRA